MAFPQVAATNSAADNTATTTPTVNLPSGISAGHLLLVFAVNDGSGTYTITDFTELFTTTWVTTRRITVLGKVAVGSDTASATTSSVKSANVTWRVTDWFGDLTTDSIAFGTAATGANANPNPPDFNPANWDVEDTLFAAFYGWDADIGHTSYPTNYGVGQVTSRTTGAGNDQGIALAGRELAAASDNPGTATIGASVNWSANTMAIRPAAGGATGQPIDKRFGGVPFTRGDNGIWLPQRW